MRAAAPLAFVGADHAFIASHVEHASARAVEAEFMPERGGCVAEDTPNRVPLLHTQGSPISDHVWSMCV